MDTAFTSGDLLLYLQITIAVVAVLVLYHVLFIVVDLRKIMRRIEAVTKEVEGIIMKPINVADQILQAVMELLEEKQKSSGKKKVKKKSSKK